MHCVHAMAFAAKIEMQDRRRSHHINLNGWRSADRMENVCHIVVGTNGFCNSRTQVLTYFGDFVVLFLSPIRFECHYACCLSSNNANDH